MNDQPGLQQLLFQQVKAKIPDNLSFVHEIADLLGISYDSAYRSIRGEKALSMEELYRLGHRFNVSLDALLGIHSNSVVFHKYSLKPGQFYIKDWLLRILEDIRRIHAAKEKEILYAAKDPPDISCDRPAGHTGSCLLQEYRAIYEGVDEEIEPDQPYQ